MATTSKVATQEILGHGEFEFFTCGICSVVWGMESGLVEQRKRDHAEWFCPNGHVSHFPEQSLNERVRAEQERHHYGYGRRDSR